MDFNEAKAELANPKNVRFNDLIKICRAFFGEPRSNGTSHHVFKVPWQGKPWINLQADGKNAKVYQVRDVLEAINKLEAMEAEKKKKAEEEKKK